MSAGSQIAAPDRSPAEIQEELRQLSQRIDRSRRTVARGEKYHSNSGYTEFAAKSAVAVYVLSDGNSSTAARKLLTFRRVSSPDPSLQQAERLVEDMVIASPDAFMKTLYDAQSSRDKRLVSSALRFVAEARTVTWVANQNEKHGVAPSSVQARDEFDRLMGVPGGDDVSKRCARQWVRRWKRRWPVKRGRLRTEEPLTAEAITGKVPWLAFPPFQLQLPDFKFSFESGTDFLPVFRAAF